LCEVQNAILPRTKENIHGSLAEKKLVTVEENKVE
jgi:hypothetical protein